VERRFLIPCPLYRKRSCHRCRKATAQALCINHHTITRLIRKSSASPASTASTTPSHKFCLRETALDTCTFKEFLFAPRRLWSHLAFVAADISTSANQRRLDDRIRSSSFAILHRLLQTSSLYGRIETSQRSSLCSLPSRRRVRSAGGRPCGARRWWAGCVGW
jgi:hypothetical protein